MSAATAQVARGVRGNHLASMKGSAVGHCDRIDLIDGQLVLDWPR